MPDGPDPKANIAELFRARKDPSLSSEPEVAKHRSNAQIEAIGFAQARRAQGESPKPHSQRQQHGKPGPKPKKKWLND